MAHDGSSHHRQHTALSAHRGKLTVGLIEVLVGDREGTAEETGDLKQLQAELKHRLYGEIIAALLHHSVDDADEARELFDAIRAHRKELSSTLGRRVSVQAAALDYAQLTRRFLTRPLIIEESDVEELLRNSIRDRLTGAYGRAMLLEDLKREIGRTRRYGSPFSLLVLDIDNLGEVNLLHGKRAGDCALRAFSDIVQGNLRVIDTLYRYEQDEFIVILPSTVAAMGEQVAGKLMTAIRDTRICPGVREEGLALTASIGVAGFNDQTVENTAEVLESADRLIARAKQAGKNRIEVLRQEGAHPHIVELPPRAAPEVRGRFIVRGIPVSRGLAEGRAFIHRDILAEGIEYYQVQETELERELERMRDALHHVKNDVGRMEHQVRANLGKDYADIFTVHKMILNDVYLVGEIEERLRQERTNAEHAVRSVFRRFEHKMLESENEALRERANDIADLTRRILRHLAGTERNIFSRLPRNRVVVAKRLLPSESVHLKKGRVRAIITEKGSKSSHAAILARGLGIPYVSETDYPVETLPQGTPLIVDAVRGEIVVNPTLQERVAVRDQIELQDLRNFDLARKVRDVSLTKDGRRIKVMANANSESSIREAISYGSDGIGLYRIEQIYLQSRMFPTKEQLCRVLDEMFEGLGDLEIVVRLLDIGGDKTLPYLDMRGDNYSFMGLRGVRFLLKYPHVLETQLTALLKLSAKYRLKILIPVVTLADEIATVRTYLGRAKQDLRREHVPFAEDIQLGAMIEVPAAVLRIKELLREADFASIGTNDLIQYLMASGRENVLLARYYDAGTDIVLPYIEKTVAAAKERGVECALCGEIAADTAYTEQLLAIGLETFSVAPSSIPKLKSRIAELLSVAV